MSFPAGKEEIRKERRKAIGSCGFTPFVYLRIVRFKDIGVKEWYFGVLAPLRLLCEFPYFSNLRLWIRHKINVFYQRFRHN